MNTRDFHIPSNRVRDIERYILNELCGHYPEGELHVFSDMLFEAFLGWDKARLLLNRDQTINQSDLLRFHWAVEDLKKHRPIQHIIGYTDFCGCRIAVSPDVLIPRPETEEIVNDLVATIQKKEHVATRYAHPPSIIDLCTGSGCIAIALAKYLPEADVEAADVSDKALSIAQRNAEDNGVNVVFHRCDLLTDEFPTANKQYGLIISNPPYVMEKERGYMQPNVLDYEPSLALFVPDDDPLLFYRAIAAFAESRLSTDGLLAVEVNESLATETSLLLQAHHLTTEIHSDFRGKARSVTATRRH